MTLSSITCFIKKKNYTCPFRTIIYSLIKLVCCLIQLESRREKEVEKWKKVYPNLQLDCVTHLIVDGEKLLLHWRNNRIMLLAKTRNELQAVHLRYLI